MAIFESEYARQRPALDQILEMITDSRKSRVLDVGCGSGYLLYRFREAGHDVKGIDLDRNLVDFTRTNLNLDVTLSSLNSFVAPEGSFDLVLMTDVLEHLPNPLVDLMRVRRLLAHDGALIVRVPNWSTGRIWAYCKAILNWMPPNTHLQDEHLNYFSSSTLRYALERAGFTDVECRPGLSAYSQTRSGAIGAIITLARRVLILSSKIPSVGLWTSPVLTAKAQKRDFS
ncbi:class I SAM-dependent methyltransferase [Candidatus Sumerlaeota bacterium]|nr:class I SAM-dependent methyltransferase [Candidatus Sumerlaeota bacterium]